MQINPIISPIYFDDISAVQTYARQNHLLLYVYKNTIYDLSEFAYTHPGGLKEICTYANTNISKIIFDPRIHKHSPLALFKMSKFTFGYIQPQKQKTLLKSKSSQSLLQQTRKNLLSATDPDYLAVPEDCCIEQVRSIKTHRRVYHSDEQMPQIK
ncbi:unnamed protein product (macronuclear) [Paramecium tetraurelia]|uniref:Cytochrome b5 heme-binding domain-containing protein n=1 Tax=Paramecium tetraurelia TaxID=5888 RepID=A0DK05_PARTE|nr:uncharacterized protein GSPATT00017716001 [Paramecium tetraurelia]CAK83372.1 unnamed protein product [Paramecium tetraurelia]|eukprot:XP_001450769.1 hypothetical protein (macronuclear) [Paramecium tetraurelia strain d4-2]